MAVSGRIKRYSARFLTALRFIFNAIMTVIVAAAGYIMVRNPPCMRNLG